METNKKGRIIVIIIIAIILVIDLAEAIISMSDADGEGSDTATVILFQQGFGFLAEGVLLFFLYKGHRWANWLIAIFLILSGSISLLFIFNPVLFVLGIVNIIIGIILITSTSVKAFQHYKKDIAA